MQIFILVPHPHFCNSHGTRGTINVIVFELYNLRYTNGSTFLFVIKLVLCFFLNEASYNYTSKIIQHTKPYTANTQNKINFQYSLIKR